MSKIIWIFLKNIFIEECDFSYWHFLKASIFKQLYFLKWRPIFDYFYSTIGKTQNVFKGLVVGFGLKGMPVRICNIGH